MAHVFLYGTLCHAPLRAVVLGCDMPGEPAAAPDHAVRRAAGEPFALIEPAPGEVAAGLVLRDPGAEAEARLGWYAAARGFGPVALRLAGGVAATAFAPRPGLARAGGPWSLAAWAAREGPVVVATAGDVMRLMGRKPAEVLRARMAQMLSRGAARLRAGVARPVSVGFVQGPGDVEPLDWDEPYAAFFAVEEHRLSHRRFDGRMGAPIGRAVFVSADAVTVLPYDPVRDRVLVIEQFRAAPWARGDARPWLIEAIAGRIDAFETAEAAARREAEEEAGIALGALHEVAGYYPSPGAKTEFLWSYVGIADLPDGAGGLGGIEGEGEDIRAHVLGFAAFMALVERGEAVNGPLVLTAHWLARHRDRLRGAGAAG